MVWAIPDFAIPDFGGSSALTACLGAKLTFVPVKMDTIQRAITGNNV
jgi:hypothetical protein